MRIVSIVGARPQFVKAGVVSRALRSVPDITEVLVHTGQHYDENMSKVFFDQLGIPRPDWHLEIGSGAHGEQTGRMLGSIEAVLLKSHPDWVLVYGDTNSTLAGALAAAKLHIPVAHVEAGLRSFNRRMPEEINRILTDHISELLFAPTETAVRNLQREGIQISHIENVGDVMYDAALFYGSRVNTESVCSRFGVESGRYILATIHRAENTDDPHRLKSICNALEEVSKEWPIVFPVHPRTRKMLADFKLTLAGDIRLIEPVGYLDMVALEKNARVIATDSGGVQKEAYFYRVPCVTLRNETEWVELVEMGWNRIEPPVDAGSIRIALLSAAPPSDQHVCPYGNGTSAEKIRNLLIGKAVNAYAL
jgi:UDP-GlcNAc3NAcA epimerase